MNSSPNIVFKIPSKRMMNSSPNMVFKIPSGECKPKSPFSFKLLSSFLEFLMLFLSKIYSLPIVYSSIFVLIIASCCGRKFVFIHIAVYDAKDLSTFCKDIGESSLTNKFPCEFGRKKLKSWTNLAYRFKGSKVLFMCAEANTVAMFFWFLHVRGKRGTIS